MKYSLMNHFLTVVDLSKLGNKNKPFFASMIGKQEFARGEVKSIINEMLVSVNGSICFNKFSEGFIMLQRVPIFIITFGDPYIHKIQLVIFLLTQLTQTAVLKENNYNIFGDPSLILKTRYYFLSFRNL
ncbi:MAG: hypothetical protein H6613_18280 [Ignavibacteriales bacterium]|nr:hypothetical protein [Ignavibacteriales bacterium]